MLRSAPMRFDERTGANESHERSGKMSATSKLSERLEETVELLGHAIEVMFLAALLLVIPCVVTLLAAGTFAALHPGNDFDFSGSGGGSGDIIVLPAQLF
jgi:hypothetical protein